MCDLKEQNNLKALQEQIEARTRLLLHNQLILETIYNGLEMGITLIDKNFKIMKANRYIARLFSKQPEDLVGDYCYHIFGEGRDQKCTTCPADNTLNASLPVSVNRKIHTPEGKVLFLQNITYPILDKVEGLTGFIHFTEDITQTVQLQNQLVQSEKFATLGKFASGITHDLRNPLTVIRNAAYYLKRKVNPNDEKITQYLNIIEREANQAERIVSNLLTFCRPQMLDLKEILITDLLEDLLTNLNIPSHITIKKEYKDYASAIKVDPEQLNRVFLNIIKNAFEAIANEGLLSIILQEQKDKIIIEFQDNGAGIPEKNKENLFEPFFTTKAKGIGLGLYICKSIIEQHQGIVKIESQEGKGTSFFVILPK